MVGDDNACRQRARLKHFARIHVYFLAQVELRTSGWQYRYVRLSLRQAMPHLVGEYGVTSDVQARFAGQVDEVAVAVLHHLADDAATMHARDGRDVPVKERLCLRAKQRLGCHAASGKIAGISRHADYRYSGIPEILLACPIKMVEMAALAMREQTVRNPLQKCRGVMRQVDEWIAPARPSKIFERWNSALWSQHGVDQNANVVAVRLKFEQKGGIADMGDLHGWLRVLGKRIVGMAAAGLQWHVLPI